MAEAKFDLDMQTLSIWALLSPNCLRLPGSQAELMDLHKIMPQTLLSLPPRFETMIPKNRIFLSVPVQYWELNDTTESLA